MDNTVTAAAVAGFLAPPVVAIINRSHWPSELKAVVAFVFCVVLAIGVTWYWRPDLDWHNLRLVLAVVFGTAIVTYHQFWKPSNIAPGIESATG